MTTWWAQPSGLQQALSDNARTLADIMDQSAVLDLTRIIYGGDNPNGLFQPLRNYLDLYAREMERRVLNQAQVANLPPEILQYIGQFLSPRPPGILALSSIPYYAQKDQALQAFFEDVLLQPINSREIAELLNNEYLMLTQDVVHIMLEYGIRARDLTDHHPRNDMAFVKYDEAVHGRAQSRSARRTTRW
ncbi:hypothetical protein PSH84_28355 [Pseudomonas beijingensis]|uniref:hypothetical protein n=1 Tax=Pseudomonas beijingensis TaxID=2954101 RepID=UPI002733424C|nr:hypothetical protein [Pseudomonas sp. FP830]WLI45321.1 hypothetical protein PSH84_28355 [Pseudomonas sp. FP830]